MTAETRPWRPERGATVTEHMGGGAVEDIVPLGGDTLGDVLEYFDWARRRRCGFCDGTGARWSRIHRCSEVCAVCGGDGRGSMLVEPGPLRDDELVAALAAEYRGIVAGRRRGSR